MCKPDHRLRVLSLFDGIGTAKVVLDNLNLDVEVYYSVEIEEDAIQVVDLNHGDGVIHLGDIRSLTEEKVSRLSLRPHDCVNVNEIWMIVQMPVLC